MTLPRRSRSYFLTVFGSPVRGSYSGTSFCAVPVLPPELMPAAQTGAKTPRAVPDPFGFVTSPMTRRISAALSGVTT